jgi:uncharacterized protein with PIN domain
LENPKFLVDGMLGKLARKLRIFGFDTAYLSNTDDDNLIKLAIDTKRNLLTKDKQLYKKCLKLNISCNLITFENELDNLISIFKIHGIRFIYSITNDFTRCTICNAEIKSIKREILSLTLIKIIPKKVFDNHSVFFICTSCGKIYWNGTHIQELNTLIDEINCRLNC